jgi:predicted amidohydrolase
MKVAVLQVAYGDDEPVDERVERVAAMVREQRGHDLVVLPELWSAGGFAYREWANRAQPVDGPVGTAMSEAARDAGVMLHAGSIVERPGDGETGPEGRGLWNTSLVYGPDGSLVATYRKIHRFGFGSGEPKLMDAGEDVVLVDLPHGAGRAGLSTCYDLRFPELYRRQLDAGATAFVVPAAWPAARVRHWTLLAHARAIEDTHAGTEMGGHSQVISAKGDALAMAGTSEEVLSVEVDMDAVTTWRVTFPVLQDRRL